MNNIERPQSQTNFKEKSKELDELGVINKKLEKELEESKIRLGDMFDSNGGSKKVIEEALPRWRVFLSVMPESEKIQEIESLLIECKDIQDKEEFVKRVIEILRPVLEFKVQRPKEFEKIGREATIRGENHIRLSEVLYCEEDKKERTIAIHLAPSTTLGIAETKKSVLEGLEKLAKMLDKNEEVEKIIAISWIFGKNPALGEKLLGFPDIRILTEEEKEKRFIKSKDVWGEGIMSREDFLKKPWRSKLKN